MGDHAENHERTQERHDEEAPVVKKRTGPESPRPEKRCANKSDKSDNTQGHRCP